LYLPPGKVGYGYHVRGPNKALKYNFGWRQP
jgi:hypothetical protein